MSDDIRTMRTTTMFAYTKTATPEQMGSSDPHVADYHYACVIVRVGDDYASLYTFATWTDFTSKIVLPLSEARETVRGLLRDGYSRDRAREAAARF